MLRSQDHTPLFRAAARSRYSEPAKHSFCRKPGGAPATIERPATGHKVARMTHEPTIFIVDDEKAVRESVAALLRAHKLPVEVFASGEEFLAAVDGSRSGCLILDMRLEGGMNGVQLQQALLKRGGMLPLIMITGHVDEKAAKEALAGGALCILQKPVPYKELLNHVHRALEITDNGRPSAT